MQSRIIDGLSIRFAESEDRDDHALLLSPWPESQLSNNSSALHASVLPEPNYGKQNAR
jgi:hypothetical protein